MNDNRCRLNIAGVEIAFTGVPLKAEKYTLPFLVRNEPRPASARHTIRVSTVKGLRAPEGELCYEHLFTRVYVKGDETRTVQLSPLGRDVFAVCRDLRGGSESELAIEEFTSDLDNWLRRVLIYTCLPHVMLAHRRLMLHASCVAGGGGAIVFCGPSGIGKSTQAALWQKYRNVQTVNGDRAIICLAEDIDTPLPFVQGVPPYREWPSPYTRAEVLAAGAAACGMPFAGSSRICYNISSPLKALVALRQGPESFALRLNGAAAARALIENSVVESWRPGENERAVELALQLAERIPVYLLECTPDISAVEALEAAMARGADQNIFPHYCQEGLCPDPKPSESPRFPNTLTLRQGVSECP